MKKLAFIISFFISINCFGETLSATPITNITELASYSEYGDGNMTIRVENTAPNCNGGFWMNGTEPGFKTVLSMLLAAKHSGVQIIIYGDSDRIWQGSPTASFCHLYLITEKT